MGEPKSVRPVMLPPPGFAEQAVERGLSEVLASEALRVVEEQVVADRNRRAEAADPMNDVAPPTVRRRRDSGIISGVHIDDTPTIPYIRVAQEE